MDIFYEEMTAEQMEKCSGQGGLTKTVRMVGEARQRSHGQFCYGEMTADTGITRWCP